MQIQIESNISDEGFTEISLDVFLNMSGILMFDVFIKLSPGKYTKIFSKGDLCDQSRFEIYANKGVKALFIRRIERREYINQTEVFIKRLVNQGSIASKDAVRAIAELSEHSLQDILEDSVLDYESLRNAQNMTNSYFRMLEVDPKLLTNFIKLCRNETYAVRHSITVAVLGIMVAQSMGITDKKMMESVGIGGLLHDLGFGQMPEEIIKEEKELTDEQITVLKTHCIEGAKHFYQSKTVTTDTVAVIEQHHEYFDGSGYPKGLLGDQISLAARIITLVDHYSSVTTPRRGEQMVTPFEALQLLRIEKKRFDPDILKCFTNLFRFTEIKAG